jgi:SSS family solute:Na+ symporter
MQQFKKTIVFYPICILAIWLPCVYLGVAANAMHDVPEIASKLDARALLAAADPSMTAAQLAQLQDAANGDDVIILMLEHYAPLWLAGLLGAGIMAAVMASDSQILALSTMFTEDVFAFYGGRRRFGERAQVQTGRLFVVLIAGVAYLIALRAPPGIFNLAVQFAFSGYAALCPLLVAALFWRRSTKWGALAVTLWTTVSVASVALFQAAVPAPSAGTIVSFWEVGGVELITRTPSGTAVWGFMPVVPMTIVSALLMVVVSRLTPRPSDTTLSRYFERA